MPKLVITDIPVENKVKLDFNDLYPNFSKTKCISILKKNVSHIELNGLVQVTLNDAEVRSFSYTSIDETAHPGINSNEDLFNLLDGMFKIQ